MKILQVSFVTVQSLAITVLATTQIASSNPSPASAPISPPTSTATSASSDPIAASTGIVTTKKDLLFLTRTGTETKDVLDATITTAPDFDGDVSSWIQGKWHLTTYWSCHTFDRTYVDCGWHEPVLPGGTEIAGAPRGTNPKMAAFMAGVAVAVGAIL